MDIIVARINCKIKIDSWAQRLIYLDFDGTRFLCAELEDVVSYALVYGTGYVDGLGAKGSLHQHLLEKSERQANEIIIIRRGTVQIPVNWYLEKNQKLYWTGCTIDMTYDGESWTMRYGRIEATGVSPMQSLIHFYKSISAAVYNNDPNILLQEVEMGDSYEFVWDLPVIIPGQDE
jgi:hypothetical protein